MVSTHPDVSHDTALEELPEVRYGYWSGARVEAALRLVIEEHDRLTTKNVVESEGTAPLRAVNRLGADGKGGIKYWNIHLGAVTDVSSHRSSNTERRLGTNQMN